MLFRSFDRLVNTRGNFIREASGVSSHYGYGAAYVLLSLYSISSVDLAQVFEERGWMDG